jgi:hypothetical protein
VLNGSKREEERKVNKILRMWRWSTCEERSQAISERKIISKDPILRQEVVNIPARGSGAAE